MNPSMKPFGGAVLLLTLALFLATPALACSDKLIQSEIEAHIAESKVLHGTRIEVHVERRLVVLTGQVRLYEQKLISDHIAWTTPGVAEVDNEIRVMPKLPSSDKEIERKIREIVKADERFRNAGVVIRVNSGEVVIKGSFFGFRDPSILKHKVAEIEGVIQIEIHAAFLAGREKMIAALQRLQAAHDPAQLPDQLAAFGIAGGGAEGLKRLFLSHPPLEERIAALRAGEPG